MQNWWLGTTALNGRRLRNRSRVHKPGVLVGVGHRPAGWLGCGSKETVQVLCEGHGRGIGTSPPAVQSLYTVDMSIPLSTMNLRRNPFGELTLGERRQLAVGEFESLARELQVRGTAVQLRGACGRGKSTHLHGLASVLPQALYSRVDHGGPVCSGGIYLMDEADHFGPLRRWWYLRRAESVAVATHADMSPFLRRCGFRVVDVPVGQRSLARLRQIVEARLEWARLAEGPLPSPTDSQLSSLLDFHGDDLRAVESQLYDWVASGALAVSAGVRATN